MNNNEIFISGYKIPKPLSNQEVYELFKKIKQGDIKAKAKLAEHNLRLVISEVTGRFNTVNYDKKDLVSVGNVGLMKAIETFDTSKKLKFSSYAIKCIDNEILMFLRQLRKYENEDSLDKTINWDKDGNELTIVDTLRDDTDFVEEYTNKEIYLIIRQMVKDLPERDKKITTLYFGFNNNKRHTQQEIADILSISRTYVSRLIAQIVKRIGKKLERMGAIELKTNQITKNKINEKKEGEDEMSRQIKTIYEYFNSYSKEEIDTMIEKLTEQEKALLTLRYGEDLNNPVTRTLTKEETNKFYGILIPIMKRLLANPNKERKSRSKNSFKPVIKQTEEKLQNSNKEQTKESLIELTLPKVQEITKQQDVETQSSNSNVESITKEDYVKLLELLRTPSFTKMISEYSPKEAMVISLKLGYIDGKSFSVSAISNFLGIEKQEIIDITKKVLIDYKAKINQIIDGAIQIAIEETEMPVKSHIIR